MSFREHLTSEARHRQALAVGLVVPDNSRCVQCGICSFNCPIGIDVRQHAWLGKPVEDSHCLTCGTCIQKCPRGVLRFERGSLHLGATEVGR
ncbi:MAG: 4Fe-4S dicluster domain-containing protein [Chloroflexi bacterium]|nr:4Fe-4S dicluster domain-containing protein [Chloroflexota bacterium]